MTIISKTAGALSIASCIMDMHNSAKIEAKKMSAKMGSDQFISNTVNAQKTNYLSKKDSDRKNWIQQKMPFISTNETLGSIKGYLVGFFSAGMRYIPNFLASAIAIGANKNHKNIAGLSTIALGLIHGWDFIKNSSGLFEKNDYLK